MVRNRFEHLYENRRSIPVKVTLVSKITDKLVNTGLKIGALEWLASQDSFLFSHLKNKIYKTKAVNIQDEITTEIRAISPQMFEKIRN